MSNNTNITFTNNNIEGFSLDAFSSNNINITVTNNNITRRYAGVYLGAYNNNNANITLNENNITCDSYGVYFHSNGSVSGISFLNNIINVTSGDGFLFYTTGSVANISDFIIRGNTIYAENGAGLNFTRLAVNSLVNVTVEYNRIISQVGVNITGYNTTDSSFDYNWWGINDITNKTFGINTNNHYILNITNSSSLDNVHIGDNVRFYLLVLNSTLINTGVENLPDFVINGTFNGVAYNSSHDKLFTYVFTILSEGNQTIDASLDEEYVIRTFGATKTSTSSTINIPSNVKVGKTITIDGVLVDENNNPIANAPINVTIDGKVYTLTTDSNGRWNLTYKPTHTGSVNAVLDYAGNDKYFSYTNTTTFNVVKGKAIVDIDLVKNPDGSVDVIVTVTDEDGDPIPNYEVSVDLDGKNIGNIVTDADGIGESIYQVINSVMVNM
jgi:hypothetical protein